MKIKLIQKSKDTWLKLEKIQQGWQKNLLFQNR